MRSNEIDVYVGQRLRERREALGISQGKLGRHLGLTFSQVQKYEKGSNRIGAGRLFQIAEYLGTQPSYFFEGLSADSVAPAGAEPPVAAASQASPEEVRVLVAAFGTIPEQGTRASVLALVKSLAKDAPGRRRPAD